MAMSFASQLALLWEFLTQKKHEQAQIDPMQKVLKNCKQWTIDAF